MSRTSEGGKVVWWTASWPSPMDFLERVGLSEVSSLVDLPCGAGYFAVPAAHHIDAVYGIDVNSSVLREARMEAQREGVDVGLFQGDPRDVCSLLPEPVEGVLVTNTFHTLEDDPDFTADLFETVAPGGRLVILDWHCVDPAELPPEARYSEPSYDRCLEPDAVVERLERVGFRHVETFDVPPWHYAVVVDRPA